MNSDFTISNVEHLSDDLSTNQQSVEVECANKSTEHETRDVFICEEFAERVSDYVLEDKKENLNSDGNVTIAGELLNVRHDNLSTRDTVLFEDLMNIDVCQDFNTLNDSESRIHEITLKYETFESDDTITCDNVSDNAITCDNASYGEYESDATIVNVPPDTDMYATAWSQIPKDENYYPPIDSRSFSPLPSTSSDNATIDINEMRLSKANSKSDHRESPILIVDDDNISHTFQPLLHTSNVIECSSGSDNDDVSSKTDQIPLKKYNLRRKIKSNEVINLLLEDSRENLYDSDCEIINVISPVVDNETIVVKEFDLSTTNIGEAPLVTANYLRSEVSPQSTIKKIGIAVEKFFESVPSTSVTDALSQNRLPDQITKKEKYDLNTLIRLMVSPASDSGTIPSDLFKVLNSKFSSEFSQRPRHRRKRIKSILDAAKPRKHTKQPDVVDLSEGYIRTGRIPASPPIMEVIVIDSDASFREVSDVPWRLNSDTTPEDPPASLPFWPGSQSEVTPRQAETQRSHLGDCPVCLDSLCKNATASTFCGHIFCLACIQVIMKSSKKCPTCRKHLKGKGYHPIFI